MAPPIWPLLFLLQIPLAWAGPLSTASLTPNLAKVIPSCAQSCVESFVAENYKTVCGPPPNFDCICVNNTPSGFTIGEGSLECLISSCHDTEESVLASVYAVCIGVPDARPNTHTILTATGPSVASPTSTASPTQGNGDTSSSRFPSKSHTSSSDSTSASSTASRSKSTITTKASSSSLHSSALSTTSPPSTIPTTSSPSSTKTKVTAAAASTSAVAGPTPVLTTPQIAGVVVASLGAAALAFGLCFLVICLRRKRSKRRFSESSFGGNKTGESVNSTPDMAAIETQDFGRHPQPREESPAMPPPMPRGPLRLVTPATSSENGWEEYQKTMTTDDIGMAVGPPIPTTAEHSPNTPKSNRTTNSQLLPDKPRYSLFPSPLRINPRNSISAQGSQPSGDPTSPQAPRSAGPPPQFPNAMDNTSQANLQGRPGPSRSLSDPFYDPRNRTPPHIYPYVQASRPASPRSKYPDHPAFRLSTQVEPTGIAARNPVPPHQSPSARFLYPSSYRTQQPNHPWTQPSSGPAEQHYNELTDNSHRRKGHSKNKSESSRPLTGDTFFSDSGSETSFENSDSEDDHDLGHRSSRPMRPRSNLSPVAESPRKLGSPFQHQQDRFHYHAVPVATTVSPMRYPRQPESLSSRRLGEQKAREIAGRLETQRQPSAKWKVLVSPGLQPLENSESPSSPSARRDGVTPPRR